MGGWGVVGGGGWGVRFPRLSKVVVSDVALGQSFSGSRKVVVSDVGVLLPPPPIAVVLRSQRAALVAGPNQGAAPS